MKTSPFKVMTSAALASALAVPAVATTAPSVVDAAETEILDIAIEVEGEVKTVSYGDFVNALFDGSGEVYDFYTEGEITAVSVEQGQFVKYEALANAVFDAEEGKSTTEVLAELNTQEDAKVSEDVVAEYEVFGSSDAEEPENIKTEVTNAVEFSGDENTVLLGETALVKATVVDDNGNPVANKRVVFSKLQSSGDADFSGNTIVTTDEDGVASVVVTGGNHEATDTANIGALKYEVSLMDGSYSTEGTVNFAAIGVNQVDVLNDNDPLDELLETPAKNTTDGSVVETTEDMNGTDVEYVDEQQVSNSGEDNNRVEISAVPTLHKPGSFGTAEVDEFTKEIGESSGAFNPYEKWDSEEYTIPEGLKYATVHVSSLVLDSTAKIQILVDGEVVTETTGDEYTIEGPFNQSSFGYQIPEDKLSSNSDHTVQVKLHAPGHVQTDDNDGITIDKITGVYDNDYVANNAEEVAIEGGAIEWSVEDSLYSDLKTLADAQAISLLAGNYDSEYNYTYQVPVFPYTGNAIIVGKDANGNDQQYFTIPTVNNTDNVNIIDSSETARLVTRDEAQNNVGNIDQNGNTLTVNSEKIGRTNLTGKISIPGLDAGVLNATNNKVYTSVHWSPVPNAVEVSSVDDAFAVAGQNIVVSAQLVDQNGNKVASSNQPINWKYGEGETALNTTGSIAGNSDVTVVSMDNSTDPNGQAKIVLNASSQAELEKFTASNTDFNVNLIAGDSEKSFDSLSFNWVNAGLSFDPTLEDGDETAPVYNNTAKVETTTPLVGTPNRYGFIVKADDNDPLTDIEIEGLPVDFNQQSGSVGQFTAVNTVSNQNAAVSFDASSTVAGVQGVTASLGSVTDSTELKMYVNDEEALYVGSGATSLYSNLTLPISWQSVGQSEKLVSLAGTTLAADGTTTNDVYVKVSDQYGNAIANQSVTFNLTGAGSLSSPAVTTTDEYGIAKVTLDGTNVFSAAQSTLTAAVGDNTLSKTFNWVEPRGAEFALVNASVNSTGDNDVVEVGFSQAINPESVHANQFKVKTTTGDSYYAVKDVKVTGENAYLTLADSNAELPEGSYTVEVSDYTPITGSNVGMEYTLTDNYGRELVQSFDSINLELPVSPEVVASYTETDATSGTVKVTLRNGNVAVSDQVRVVADDASVSIDGNGTVVETTTNASGEVTLNVATNGSDLSGTAFTVYYNGAKYTVFAK